MHLTLKTIVDLLDRFHQRATYGAVAGVVGKVPRSVMQGLPKNWRHSWVVNQEDGEPSEYHFLQKHPALHERTAVLSSTDDLSAWLANPQ